ncbi:MAG: DNA recombination protein RmuC [Puniceicoccales bacterium]|jgi:DNA recombination protein RmuC|nr:DNA recombination protein RmuC [Puniceicoccales bacterium]
MSWPIAFAIGAAAVSAAAIPMALLLMRSRELRREREMRQNGEAALRDLGEKYHSLDREYAEFRGREAERSAANGEKIALLGKMRDELEASFGVAAAKASAEAVNHLREGNRESGNLERERLEATLKPMRECVERLGGQLQRSDRNWNESMARFGEQMGHMLSSNRELDRETKRLGNALRHSHVRGRWGELQLRRLVEMAGLREHVDFEEQVAVAADGNALRADMVVHLPGGRSVVVDAKAVIEAYGAAEEEQDPEKRRELRKQHGQNVFLRVQELGRKNYWKFFPSAFDCVVLFLPGDHLYAAAVDARPDLFDEAIERHVLLASPMTLLALLKTAANGWAQEATAKEAAAIVSLAKTLLERTQIVWEKLSDVGRHLRRSVDAYNGTLSSIESRLRPTLQNFSRMKSIGDDEPRPPEAIEIFPRPVQLENGNGGESVAVDSAP